MRVFVTGGSGQTGPAIVEELVAHGHVVTGLARSDASAATLEKLGAHAVRGSLEDLDVLRQAAREADGVIHMAYGGDFSDPEPMIRRDVNAITALGEALQGSGKPLVITSGTLVMAPGAPAREVEADDSSGLAAFRVAGERACMAFTDRGVRTVVMRLAPTVHGPRDHGFIPMLVETARTRGVSGYVGDGANRWPAVNRADAAELFRLALEKAPAGSYVHAVAENVAFADIATTIGAGLGLPTSSLTPEEAAGHFANPFMAMLYGADVPADSTRTQELLGWHPSRPGLLADLTDGDYLA